MAKVPMRSRVKKYSKLYYKRKYRMGRMMSRLKPRITTFTETYPYFTPTLMGASGYVLYTNFREIPQNLDYSALYRQFCIKKVQFILVPRWNVADAAGGQNLLRTTYAVQDTPSGVVPPAEINVLEDNGCKITTASRVLRINCYPKPLLQSDGSIIQGIAPAFNYRKGAWLNTDNPENDPATTGTQLNHYGVNIFISGLNNNTPAYDVFVKTTFSLRDAA